MIITIDGTVGSGKSTVVRLLAQRNHLREHSMGERMRQLAKARHMTLRELNEIRWKDDSIDRDVDQYLEELGKTQDNFAVSTRVGHKFIPHAIKIFLKVNEKEAARRIWQDMHTPGVRDEGTYKDVNEVEEWVKKRNKDERAQYLKVYDIDVNSSIYYDLVIDTTNISVEQVVKVIEAFIDRQHK
jgi:cytidylate kinase